jgi:NAD(P)-dependent dehydrogenase (short-subunit alcohol dehydrogenase family)
MRTILITGAGSGLGEGAAIGLAREGHEVIATAQGWPQVTALRARVESQGISCLRVEKLDLLDPFDVHHALSFSFDILVNNAGIAEGGPISEIPVDLVRRNFETNVFAPLSFTQRVVKRWVREKTAGKIVFLSSIGGLLSPPGFAAYAATKHAVEAMREMVGGLIGSPAGRMDPSDMIEKMIEVIPQATGKFRNLHPKRVEDAVKVHQKEMFEREI